MYYVIVLLFVIFVILWCVSFPVSKYTYRRRVNETSTTSKSTDRFAEALRAAVYPNVATESFAPERADCSSETRFCDLDSDCTNLCREYANMSFHCDEHRHTCEPKTLSMRVLDAYDHDDDDDNDDHRTEDVCDLKNGEYAMLVGYTNLGAALWKCVNLYRHFRDTSQFCEDGVFDIDARVREPSYRDCLCPKNSKRAIFARNSLYDVALPHCIRNDDWLFYSTSMIDVSEEVSKNDRDFFQDSRIARRR